MITQKLGAGIVQIILGSSLNNVVPHHGLFADGSVNPDHDSAVPGHDGKVLTKPGKRVYRIAAGGALQVSYVSDRGESQ